MYAMCIAIVFFASFRSLIVFNLTFFFVVFCSFVVLPAFFISFLSPAIIFVDCWQWCLLCFVLPVHCIGSSSLISYFYVIFDGFCWFCCRWLCSFILPSFLLLQVKFVSLFACFYCLCVAFETEKKSLTFLLFTSVWCKN